MKTYKQNGWDVPEGFVDDLAQEIRRADGDHSLGAGALAEALMPFIFGKLQPPAKTEVSAEPVEYQSRIRAMWMDEGEGWTDWERCTEAVYRNLLENPTHHNKWQYEVRAIYLAQPDAQAIRDAARYRWLRDKSIEKCFGGKAPAVFNVDDCFEHTDEDHLEGESLDAVVDAAMKKGGAA